MHIVLQGRPMSNNNIYKTMCRGNFPTRYLCKKASDLKNSYVNQIRGQWKSQPLTGPLNAVITTYHDNKRKNDWDNFHKLSMDAMTGIVYVDDSQIQTAIVKRKYDKENPRIEIGFSKANKGISINHEIL